MKNLFLFKIIIIFILFYCYSYAAETALPPDPKKAGKQTLLGIDSDNDGVRDDLQRYIYFKYPREKNIRLTLLQIARIYQDVLINSNEPELSFENVKKLNCTRECLYDIGGDIDRAIRIRKALQAEVLNTKERSLKYMEFNKSLGGKVYEEEEKCCPF